MDPTRQIQTAMVIVAVIGAVVGFVLGGWLWALIGIVGGWLVGAGLGAIWVRRSRASCAPPLLTFRARGRLAQLGEHQLDKLGVTGSNPVTPTLGGRACACRPFVVFGAGAVVTGHHRATT